LVAGDPVRLRTDSASVAWALDPRPIGSGARTTNGKSLAPLGRVARHPQGTRDGAMLPGIFDCTTMSLPILSKARVF
jgi:hypothetical protein